MDKVYLVLHISPGTEVKATNLYLNQEVALDMAYSLASEVAEDRTLWLAQNPDKEVLDDGSARWVFFETSKQYVGVLELPVNDKTFSPGAYNDLVKQSATFVASPPFSGINYPIHVNRDDKLDGKLPGGFDLSGKPIKLEVLLTDPHSVLSTYSLSDKHREALVTARIRAIPNYTFKWASGEVWTKDHTIFHINKKLEHAKTIIDFECDLLDGLRVDAIDKLNVDDYEDESSSSSEDEW